MRVEEYAEAMFSGSLAQALAEDAILDFWPDCDYLDHIGFDSYDGSIEIYFTKSTPSDLLLTGPQARMLANMGFMQGWCNFADGSEQRWAKDYQTNIIGVGKRRMIDSPRWMGGDDIQVAPPLQHVQETEQAVKP